MQILAKLPQMDDASLTVLYGNAERLMRIGTKTQQASATAVIPAIEAELAARKEAKVTKTKAAAEARRPPNRSASPPTGIRASVPTTTGIATTSACCIGLSPRDPRSNGTNGPSSAHAHEVSR
jgi:hypothetical protein